MKIVATRESDNATFELADNPRYNSYVISSATQLPSPASNELTGYESNGQHGGYTTAARYQRRTFDLKFKLDGRAIVSNDGVMALLARGKSFFRIAQDDLTAELFTLDFYTDDANRTAFRMRHGAVAGPFSASFIDRATRFADGGVSFIFGDPFLYPVGDDANSSGTIVRLTLHPIDGAVANNRGRVWTTPSGADWAKDAGAKWAGGATGEVVAVNFTTEVTSAAEIEISGQISNPSVINITNGSEFSYSGDIPAGRTLKVTSDGAVTIDGQPAPGIYSGRVVAQQGVNEFVMSGDATDANASATLLLRGAF